MVGIGGALMIASLEISQHAIRRYFERVLQCDCEWPLKRGYGEWKTIRWAADTYGYDVGTVRAAIRREVNSLLPVTVINRGSRVRLRGASCVWMVEDGYVVTTCLSLTGSPRKDARDAWGARRHNDEGYAL